MTNEDRVFAALADGNRRQLLRLLASGERSVAEVTSALPVTQSAVSQHLRVLKDAGLVSDRAAGTRRFYRVERDGLGVVRAYVDAFWDDVLEAFTSYTDRRAAPAHPAAHPATDQSAHPSAHRIAHPGSPGADPGPGPDEREDLP